MGIWELGANLRHVPTVRNLVRMLAGLLGLVVLGQAYQGHAAGATDTAGAANSGCDARECRRRDHSGAPR